MSTALLLLGYGIAVPLTVWVPGFLRVWRRRETSLYAAAQVGAACIVAGHALRGNAVGVGINAVWLVGFAVAYAAEGRKRARLAA